MQTEQQMLPDEREERPWFAAERLLVVAAHPDDEVIGLGGQLPFLRGPQFIHVTDGAPGNLVDAKANGFSDRTSYARARRRELETALGLAGVGGGLLPGLGFVDRRGVVPLIGVDRCRTEGAAGNKPLPDNHPRL